MRRRTAGYLGLVALTTHFACSLLQGNRGTTPANQAGAGAVQTFTDADVVTGVAAAGSAVYVATERGVLRYTAEGGTPTRFGTAEGLPSARVLAIAASNDGVVWAATSRGVAKLTGERFAPVSDAQPEVGEPTALMAMGPSEVLLGGTRGLARFDGTHWYVLSDRYQVIGFASDQGRPLVATAQSGMLALRGDFTSLDEYASEAGIPELLVRNVVPVGGGKLWALVQGSGGSKLAYFDGHRWYGYSNEHVNAPWVALVPNEARNGAALVVGGAVYDIVPNRGDELIATEAGNPDGQRRVELHARLVEPPPPPPPPPAPPAPPPPTRGRGHGHAAAHPAGNAPAATTGTAHAPAGTAHAPAGTAHAPAGTAHAPAGATTTAAATPTTATTPATAAAPTTAAVPTTAATPSAGADAGVAAATTPAGTTGAPLQASADAGTATPTAAPAAAERAAAPGTRAPRVMRVPTPLGPTPLDTSGGHIEAPTFGLVRNAHIALPEDAASIFADPTGIYAVRIGQGVSRVAGGAPVDYRAHDLAMADRPLSLATDTRGNVWFTYDEGNVLRFDGLHLEHRQLDADPNVVPLLFWSHGSNAYAVSRVGPNVLRTYRLGPNGWAQALERPIDTRGPGTVHAKFLAVDDRGRYWVGLRVTHESGPAMELGVAVIDDALPAATQFDSHVAPTGGEQGARPTPDDLSGVAFDRTGTAWFAGLTGATSIALPPGGATEATVHTYNETSGLRGDSVTGVSRGPNERVYIATPEGLGYWDGSRWGFDLEGSSAAGRVIALTVDNIGTLWGAGPRGAWSYDGMRFRPLGAARGLPSEGFLNLVADGNNRLWFVTDEALVVFTPSRATSNEENTSGGT